MIIRFLKTATNAVVRFYVVFKGLFLILLSTIYTIIKYSILGEKVEKKEIEEENIEVSRSTVKNMSDSVKEKKTELTSS